MGEVLKAYSKKPLPPGPLDPVAMVRLQAPFDPMGLLRPDARAAMEAQLAAQMAEARAAGAAEADLPDIFYYRNRLPNWLGAIRAIKSFERQPVVPLGAPALADAIREQIDRHAPLVASASGGNVHNGFALIRHPRPYDFLLSDEDGPPLDPDAEPVTEALVRAALEAGLERDRVRLREIRRIAGEGVIQLESPPPLADGTIIAAQADAYFRNRGIAELGVAPAGLRYKIWRLHSRIVAGYCADLGLRFLPAPAGTRDARGFLRPEFAGDATHGNQDYGEAVIRALEAL
jgi:hypothetical protein